MKTAKQQARSVLYYWFESLSIFSKKNLKNFFLITLNATIKGLKVLCTYWWPLLLGYIFILLVDFKYLGIQGIEGMRFGYGMGMFLRACLLILSILSIRASVHLKNYQYFFAYRYYANVQILLAFLIGVTFYSVVIPYTLLLILFPSILFYLDSGSPKNIVRSVIAGCKMLMYNMPFFLLSYVLSGIVFGIIAAVFFLGKILLQLFLRPMYAAQHIALGHIIEGIFNVMGEIAVAIIFLLSLCWFCNFYIKMVYEQSDLYFKQACDDEKKDF